MPAFASFCSPVERPIRQIVVYNFAEGSAPQFTSILAVLKNTGLSLRLGLRLVLVYAVLPCHILQEFTNYIYLLTYLSPGQFVTRSTRHTVDSSQTSGQLVTVHGQLVTSKGKQTSKPYCRSSN